MKLKILLLPLITLSLCAGTVYGAQEGMALASPKWEFAGWYGGGCYPNVEFDPQVSGRVYLSSDVAGLWRSDDLGEHWYFINHGLTNLNIPVIAIAPSDSNVLYVGMKKGGVCRSKNAGRDWESCANPGDSISFKRPDSYRSIVVSPSNPAFVVLGTASGLVLYSTDFGDHWRAFRGIKKPFGDGEPVSAIRFSAGGRALWIAAAKGMIKFSLNGGRWTRLEKSPEGITDFFISNYFPNRIYAAGKNSISVSEDAGLTWTSLSPIPRDGIIYRIAVWEKPGKADKILITRRKGWSGGLFYSEDAGHTWTPADKNLKPDVISNPTRRWASVRQKSNSLKADPFHPEVVFRTDEWGVWRSDDYGQTWHEKIVGAPNTVGSDIQITRGGMIYVATLDDGLLRSSDGGKTYKPLFPSRGYKRSVNGHVWRVLVLGRKNIIATSSPWNDKTNQVIISHDGGAHFTIIRKGLPLRRPKKNTAWKEGYPRAFAVNPEYSRQLYLGIDGDDGGGFFVSKDGGETWTRPPRQPGSRKIYNALCVDPLEPKRIFWGAYGPGGGIYRSEDAGESWQKVFNGMKKIFTMAVSADGVILCAGEDDGPVLYISEDRGEHWRLLKKFPVKGSCDAICLDPHNAKIWVIGTVRWGETPGGHIFFSADSGKQWADITGELSDSTGPAAMAIHPVENKLYVLLHHGSVYKTSLSFLKKETSL